MMEIGPIDLREIDKRAANVYEAIIVAGKRARQINDDTKIAFTQEVGVILPPSTGDDESEDILNPPQLKISLEYEKKNKPHVEALHELLDGEVAFEYKQSNKPGF
jgi:DNA-directed RNA polymerase subunit K/omega